MENKQRNSAAFKFVQYMWDHAAEGRRQHSWMNINHSMHSTLLLAVKSAMRFSRGDFERIFNSFRGWFWFGCEHEGFYRSAVTHFNMSACHSYEAWCKRKPFIWENQRMYVGRQFFWRGQRVTCTSFNDEQRYFVAVSYKDRKPNEWGHKPKNIFKITHADLRTAKAALKQPKAMAVAA